MNNNNKKPPHQEKPSPRAEVSENFSMKLIDTVVFNQTTYRFNNIAEYPGSFGHL